MLSVSSDTPSCNDGIGLEKVVSLVDMINALVLGIQKNHLWTLVFFGVLGSSEYSTCKLWISTVRI